jgi:hypothetical protein
MHRIFSIINNYYNLLFFIFKCFEIKFSHDRVFVIDIDNTIADTWPTLLITNRFSSEKNRYASLEPFISIKDFIDNDLCKISDKKIFLSARDHRNFDVTLSWLKDNGFFDDNSELYLVPNAYSKIPYLKSLILFKFSIVYLDDLSYNHENGEVRFYESIIEFAMKSKYIKYIGYKQIQKYHVE